MGDYGSAISDYTLALWRDSNFASAYHNRGIAHQNAGNTSKASADFAKAKELGYYDE
jgi:Flp pilus assembly protein TadD